jgi:hypothetical protein
MTDWLPELDDDDLDTLGEALEAWEHEGIPPPHVRALVFGAVAEAAPELPGLDATIQKMLARERSRKDRALILRAKLLMLGKRRRVERIQVKL